MQARWTWTASSRYAWNMPRLLFLRSAVVAGLVLAWASPASAQCPVGTRITIDFDLPGSGYSETSNNWATWNTAPCNGAGYRYLSLALALLLMRRRRR